MSTHETESNPEQELDLSSETLSDLDPTEGEQDEVRGGAPTTSKRFADC